MAAPVVSFYDISGTNEITNWPLGEVDAGSETEPLEFTIWNNKGGSEPVSHMKNVRITTVNSAGGETGDVVTGKWVHVVVNGEDDSADGHSGKAIGGNSLANQAQVWAEGVDKAVDGYIIKGDANDGVKAHSTVNYASIKAWVCVPANANEGEKPFIVRVPYSYT